jgi:hypothetical protein
MKLAPVALITIAFILVFTSCKKGNNNKSSTGLPKTFTEDVTSAGLGHLVETVNLQYDGNGRITSLVSTTTPGTKSVYQYNSNNTFTMDLYESNQLTIHEIFWIGGNSFVDSTFQYDNTNDTSTEKYTYNSGNQLIQLRAFDFSTTSGSTLYSTDNYSYDNNGNLSTDVGDFTTTSYDYFPNLSNSLNVGEIYFVKTKNLVNTMTQISGGVTSTITHAYTFDGSNRLTVDSAAASDGGIDIKRYSY